MARTYRQDGWELRPRPLSHRNRRIIRRVLRKVMAGELQNPTISVMFY